MTNHNKEYLRIEKSKFEDHIFKFDTTLNYLAKTIPETIFRIFMKRERENQIVKQK